MTIANAARSELPTPRPRALNIWGPSRGNTKASMDRVTYIRQPIPRSAQMIIGCKMASERRTDAADSAEAA